MVSMDNHREANYRGPDLKLLIRDLRDQSGGSKKRAIKVRSWSTIKDVKDLIQQLLHVPPSSQRLYFGPLLSSNVELPNHRTLQDAGIYRSGETLLLDIGDGNRPHNGNSDVSLQFSNDVCVSSSMYDSTPKRLRQIVQKARRGFSVNLKPEFVLDGSGGTYFLRDARKNKVAVFKPADEEPYAENNPRGYLPGPGSSSSSPSSSLQGSLRDGIRPGEACLREVAAFLLDHDGLSGVPMTTLAEARHPGFNCNGSRLRVAEGGASIGSHSIEPRTSSSSYSSSAPPPKKVGSFQEFVKADSTMDDISPSKISAYEVQKIAILDIRIMNADRNAANLLVRRRFEDDTFELIPIDHGFSLRSVCDVSWMDWCWLDWPQLKKPVCDELKTYIENLDIEADARMLKERLNICEEAIDYFRASSSLLKAGVKAGLTLYDISCMCCRNDNQAVIPSMMEKLFSMASDLANVALENDRWHHTAASRALAEQLSRDHQEIATPFHPSWKQLPRTPNGDQMRKSSSSMAFLNLMKEGRDEQAMSDRLFPAMAQSSASSSDTGSQIDDGTMAEKDECEDDDGVMEKYECEEWAATVIADVRFDQISHHHVSGGGRRQLRSCSVTSDDASTDSGGFWHVRPGTSPISFCGASEDGSVCWSPAGSPRTIHQLRRVDMAECPEPPLMISKGSVNTTASKIPTVTLAEASGAANAKQPAVGTFIPPAAINVEQFNSGVDLRPPALRKTGSAGMARSKSYSALSAALRLSVTMDSGDTSGGGSNHCTLGGGSSHHQSSIIHETYSEEQYETYRKYFHNFIDLVIVRETTTASIMHAKEEEEERRSSNFAAVEAAPFDYKYSNDTNNSKTLLTGRAA